MNTSRSRSRSFLLFVGIAVCTSVTGAWGAVAPDPLAPGRHYTSWFYAGETDRLWQLFSPEMKKLAGSAEGLKKFRDDVIQQAGNETMVLAEHVQPAGHGVVVYERTATFSAAPSTWLVQWTVKDDGTVTGFFVHPAPQEALALADLTCGRGTALPSPLKDQIGQPLGASLGHCLDPARPSDCCCPNTPAKTTRLEGRGPNCTAALDNLSTRTDDQVVANCAIGSDGVCTEGDVIVTIACAYNSSEHGYSVTGYRRYTCQYCN